MNTIPEGTETVSGEGADLRGAITNAADVLGIGPNQVGYKLDLSHFRSAVGGSVARTTVKIIAWARTDVPAEEPAEAAEEAGAEAAADAPAAAEKSEKKPAKRPRKPKAEASEAAEASVPSETTEASTFAQGWFETLMGHMNVEATVKATGNDERVRIWVRADKAGRIIGRRGSTLGAIRHLLKLSLASYGDFIIDVDVDDDRKREDSRSERSERSDRDERRSRGRGRDRDRDDRRGRGRGRGRRDSDRKSGAYPEEKLQAVARRAAEKASETGRSVTINLKLNSYDRRVIHVEVAEIDGVESQSVMKDDVKYVQVVPLFSQD